MNGASSRPLRVLLAVAVPWVIASCGSSSTSSSMNGNTQVAFVMSGAANDWMTGYYEAVPTITLTSSSGRTVTLLSTARGTELVHLNGAVQPLAITAIPQDIYTSATIDFAAPGIHCVALTSNGVLTNGTVVGQAPASNVTLASPLVVSGPSMGLALNVLVARAAAAADCPTAIGPTSAITSTWSITPLALSGRATSLIGEVAAVDVGAGTFALTLPSQGGFPGGSVTVSVGSASQWLGISGLNALATGAFVQLDGALEADGSVAAKRVAVANPSAVDIQTGPVTYVDPAVPFL